MKYIYIKRVFAKLIRKAYGIAMITDLLVVGRALVVLGFSGIFSNKVSQLLVINLALILAGTALWLWAHKELKRLKSIKPRKKLKR